MTGDESLKGSPIERQDVARALTALGIDGRYLRSVEMGPGEVRVVRVVTGPDGYPVVDRDAAPGESMLSLETTVHPVVGVP